MGHDKYINIFRETGALLEGHFILTSGRHSPTYFQCAKVLQYPEHLAQFTEKIADHFVESEIDTVISPVFSFWLLGVSATLPAIIVSTHRTR